MESHNFKFVTVTPWKMTLARRIKNRPQKARTTGEKRRRDNSRNMHAQERWIRDEQAMTINKKRNLAKRPWIIYRPLKVMARYRWCLRGRLIAKSRQRCRLIASSPQISRSTVLVLGISRRRNSIPSSATFKTTRWKATSQTFTSKCSRRWTSPTKKTRRRRASRTGS